MDKIYNVKIDIGFRNYGIFEPNFGEKGYHIYDKLSIHEGFICWGLSSILIGGVYETY